MLASNLAFNPIKGMKSIGADIHKSARGDAHLSHAFRNKQGRQDFENHVAAGKTPEEFKYDRGTLSYKRIGAVGAAGYVAGDAAYRTVSGGSAYRNHTGRKDMVGIPII